MRVYNLKFAKMLQVDGVAMVVLVFLMPTIMHAYDSPFLPAKLGFLIPASRASTSIHGAAVVHNYNNMAGTPSRRLLKKAPVPDPSAPNQDKLIPAGHPRRSLMKGPVAPSAPNPGTLIPGHPRRLLIMVAPATPSPPNPGAQIHGDHPRPWQKEAPASTTSTTQKCPVHGGHGAWLLPPASTKKALVPPSACTQSVLLAIPSSGHGEKAEPRVLMV
ncbi:hypothetical protein I3842_03G249600 [Carya illinoinensis]|uniref:Uncharacterized protein n=1 Tax=Carya illinoinensis TaxID=32201 RepID=A0A922JX50_CARIL|nr:hypothetical protein I3842_03G249600 [Carya illinoinensis]